jgi:hypothetical protein
MNMVDDEMREGISGCVFLGNMNRKWSLTRFGCSGCSSLGCLFPTGHGDVTPRRGTKTDRDGRSWRRMGLVVPEDSWKRSDG